MNLYRIKEKRGSAPTSKKDIFYFPQVNTDGFWENLHGSNDGIFVTKVKITSGESGWKDKIMAERVIKFYKSEGEA